MSSLSEWLSLRAAPIPSAAVQIAGLHVGAAAVDLGGSRPSITAHAVEALPAGAVQPALTGTNMHDREAVLAGLRRVLDAVGRPRRVALIVPDTVAKVSLLKFEQTPAGADLDRLIRWQVRKSAPFPIEEAQVSYVPGARYPDGQEFLVTVARQDVVREYEDVCQAAGAHAGLVDLATLNVANTVLAGTGASGDWLLVNVAADSASIVILRGGAPIFFRNRAAEADGTLADLVHQTAMYYQDRLQGGGFSHVWLSGAATPADRRQGDDVERMRRSLEQRLSMSVETVDLRRAVGLSDRIAAGQDLLDALAPMVGALLRSRSVAA